MALRPMQRKSADEARDDHGKWTSEGGAAEGEHEISHEDLAAFEKHDDKLAVHLNKVGNLHDAASDHVAALEKIHKDLGKAVEKAGEHFDAMNDIRSRNGLDEMDKEGTTLEHGENLHEALGDAIDRANEHIYEEKYGHSGQKRSSTLDFFESAREFKFITDGLPLGEFKGYGAFFGNVDSHGDVIEPGAFVASLAERKAQGRGLPSMHVMHGAFGGDGLPIGKWLNVEEDDKGLRVHGKISGVDTETGKLHLARIADGAYAGLSIGYSVPKGGSAEAPKTRTDGAKRLLKRIDLHEISPVDEPSNAMARFDELKAAARARLERKEITNGANSGIGEADEPAIATANAVSSIRACMQMHAACMMGGDSPDADERAQMLGHLQDAHEALTGRRVADGMKAIPDLRQLEKALRDEGLSRSQARDFVAVGVKQLHAPRDEAGGQASKQDETKAVQTAAEALSFL